MKTKKAMFIVFSLWMLSSTNLLFSQSNSKKNDLKFMEISKKTDEYIKQIPEHQSINGVVLLSLYDSIIYHKGFGYADVSHRIKNTKNTQFQVGSVTKPFTAVLVLQLVEKGLLSLDDHVSAFFPDFPGGDQISIHHLLTHTSGIPQHYISIPNFFESFDKQYVSRKEMLSKIGELERISAPGEKFIYTSLGYYVLATIIEKIKGMSFSEVMREQIFIPAGMKHSYIENNKIPIENMAQGYERGINNQLIKCNYENKSVFKGAGDLVTTAYDLFLFHQALDFDSGLLLKDENKHLLFKQYEQNYGYGFMNFSFPTSKGDTIFLSSHEGGSYGYSAIFDHIPSHDGSIIIVTNIQSPGPFMYREVIGDFLINSIDPIFPIKRLEYVNGPDAKLDKMLAIYQNSNGRKVSITKLENRYYYCIPGVELKALMNQNGNTYDLSGGGRLKIRIDEENMRFDILRNNKTLYSAEKYTSNEDLTNKYDGKFISLELQQTIDIKADHKHLVVSGFNEKELMFYASKKENVFVNTFYKIIYMLDDKQELIGFKLYAPWTDQMFGSVFEKL